MPGNALCAAQIRKQCGTPDRENVGGMGIVNYVYDGQGRRVQKWWTAANCPGSAATCTTTYVYDARGQLAVETSNVPSTTLPATEYLTADQLGSTRLVTDGSGNPVACYDYLPFGEELGQGMDGRLANGCYPASGVFPQATDATSLKFTGKERDVETGLDYFGARYMSSAQGRFTSPDPKVMPGAYDDPQSWNKYGYVRNNPLRLVDPDGEDWLDIFNGTANAVKSNATAGLGRESGNSDFRLGQKIGDAISVVGGGIEMIASAVSIGGGGAACATGAGCVAGAPAIVEGLVVGAHGVSTAGNGIKNLMNANAQEDHSGTSGGQQSPSKPEAIADQIEKGGCQVKQNPKSAGQEGNVTITHSDDPSRKLNVRVETGPIPGSSDPVRHANVQVIKTSESGNKRTARNIHITEDK